MTALRTSLSPSALEQARDWFFQNGISISDWAVAQGFRRELVYAVLGGRIHGCRGEAHRVAVALGLKPSGDSGSVVAGVGPRLIIGHGQTAEVPGKTQITR